MNTGYSKLASAFLLSCVLWQQAASANLPAGRVVWWGEDDFWKQYYSTHTNGVIESENEILTNVVAVAANTSQGLLLKSDGTVLGIGHNFRGGNDVPSGLSNIVSIAAEGGSYWAIKHDGTVTRWGEDQDEENLVARLTNIKSIIWAGYRNYLAMKSNGTVLGFRFDNSIIPVNVATGIPLATNTVLILPVKVCGQVLSNVVALASMGYTPLVLKSDGSVFSLGYQTPGAPPTEPQYQVRDNVVYETLGGESAQLPYQYTSTDPVMIDGRALSNVVSLASGGGHILALNKDGTVVAWDNNSYDAARVPAGLSNVIAVAAGDNQSMALKRDGTVVAWGNNQFGQSSVPAGLSNVIAIASAGNFSLAITTGSIPASVYIIPHGQLEIMARKADLIFKGQVVSDLATTNGSFPDWAKPHATEFKIISVLNGKLDTNTLIFWHYTGHPMAWGGSGPPESHSFEVGQSYLVYAAKLDKPDYLYTVPSDAVSQPNEFRQLYDGGVMRTLDARALSGFSFKEAHWFELNLLLNDTNPTNQLYAIDRLDEMSLAGRGNDEWQHSDDFKRKTVLSALLFLVTNRNEKVASRAISCFAVETNAVAMLEPFANTLIKVANENPSSQCRLAAIGSLPAVYNKAVSNSLSQLLKDPDENIRVGAVRLLPKFPDAFAEQGLRERADDSSAKVRSVVADVIGDEKYERALPTLVKLFADPVGKGPLIKPMTMEYLKAGQRWSNIGDVHTSAGLALVKFAPDQVADILKTNLNDPGFHINFVAKLAQGDAVPWLPELVGILEARRAYVDDVVKSPWNDPRRFADPQADRILIGTYAECWEDIRQYLMKQSPEELASGKYDRYMDLLENTIQPVQGVTVYPAKWLYELYQTKHLTKRVAELRQKYDAADGWWFDDFNKRGEAAQVNPIKF